MYLEHANITVNSIDKAIEFLQAAFPEFQRRGEGAVFGDASLGRWVHFGTDDTYLSLNQMTAKVEGRERSTHEVGTNHLGFVVDDIYGVIERLEAAGYTMTEESCMGTHPFRERAYFFDDSGLEWEFVQYLSKDSAERNDYKL